MEYRRPHGRPTNFEDAGYPAPNWDRERGWPRSSPPVLRAKFGHFKSIQAYIITEIRQKNWTPRVPPMVIGTDMDRSAIYDFL